MAIDIWLYLIYTYIHTCMELYIYTYIYIHTYFSNRAHFLLCLSWIRPVAGFLHIFPVSLECGMTMAVSCRKHFGIESNLDIW